MGESEIEKITEEDFFKKQQIFQIWLIKKKKKKFEDLESKKQKKYFKKFMKKYNKKKLNEIFYQESKLLQKYGSLLHTHNWNMKLNNKDLDELNQCMTHAEENFEQTDLFSLEKMKQQQKNEQIGPQKSLQDKQYDREVKREYEDKQRKYDRKLHRREQEEMYDELIPKKLGKEAMLEKKRMLNQKINGGKDDTGINDYGDDYLLGGDSKSSFQQAKMREERRNQYRNQRKYEDHQQQSYESQDLMKKHQDKEDRAMKMIFQGGKQFTN